MEYDLLSELKGYYELQIEALEGIIENHSSIPTSPSEILNSFEFDEYYLFRYDSAKNGIHELKQKLSPDVKSLLKIRFASLPRAGAPVESVGYSIALKDAPASALKNFQNEFHKHDYHQFAEWRNYADYLIYAATTLKAEGHIEKSMEYKKAAFHIYEEILPIEIDAFELLKQKKLPACLYNARTQTTGELGGPLTTDEVLELAYYEAGNLGLILDQTEPALNFLLLSQRLARANKIDRPYLPYLIALAWHDLGGKEKKLRYFELAAASYDEYFSSNPKTISLNDYIRAAEAALTVEQTDRADSWMRKAIDTLKVTKESDRLNFKRTFKSNSLTLAGIAHKAGDYHGALYFYEAILQNEAILNQPDLSSSIQYYNAGTMAYLAKDYAKAVLYLSQVNREDPWVAKDARIGRSIDIWLEEIASPSGSFPSSSAGPSRSYES
ncbi:MAG: hypothetical protein K2Y08_01355 [Alphaproteobacteria bacterium]|nr:hypothetical protein [Alphaproteobacteria bacterium]